MHEGRDQTFVCRESDMRDYYRSDEEVQANCFSASLLMPRELFRNAVAADKPSMKTAHKAAGLFGTSLTAATIRLSETSDYRCAVIMSSQDGIEWAWENKHFKVVVDRRRNELNDGSYAYDILHGAKDQPTASVIDASTWLYFDEVYGAELCESSMGIPSWGRCLTLLWLRET
jgi:Zn-dependent peptidase ImmA (M78 family)